MALQVINLERRFKYGAAGGDVELADPNPKWDADAVMNFYSNVYPELTTATVQGPEMVDDKMVQFKFLSTAKTKG